MTVPEIHVILQRRFVDYEIVWDLQDGFFLSAEDADKEMVKQVEESNGTLSFSDLVVLSMRPRVGY